MNLFNKKLVKHTMKIKLISLLVEDQEKAKDTCGNNIQIYEIL
jgi:hypothetical protein